MKKYQNGKGKSFLVIPKCGTTSIINGLDLRESLTFQPVYPSFTVIREPEDRVRSAYHEALRRGTFRGSLLECLDRIYSRGHFDNHLFPADWYYEPVDKIFVFGDHPEQIKKWTGITIPHENRSNYKDDWKERSLKLFNLVYQSEVKLFDEILQAFF